MSIGAGDETDTELTDATNESESGATFHHSPLARDFQRLKALQDSHRRGYDFQDFIGTLFKRQHFSVVPNARTAKPRQTDLLATRGDITYLVETKWRKSKANINDVDSLFARLDSAPPTVTGLMVSYAGFTREVVAKVELRSNRPVILLNGDELEQLVDWDRDIATLLARKKSFLLTHRRVFFVEAGDRRTSPRKGRLAVSPAEFVSLDGTRSKWIHGAGDFGEFAFVQELPDVDWNSIEGRSVTLDVDVPVHDERGIVALLHHLSDLGWATAAARWSIQQATTNWHGMGVSEFAQALQGWRQRYKGIPTHHSEEFCYFDVCDGGFYALTSKISAHYDRSASYTVLSFQLTGIPLDTDPLKELVRAFEVREPCYFRPMERKSVTRKWNLRGADHVLLEPIAFIVEREEVFGTGEELARGIVAKNPYYRPGSPLVERVPDWLPSHVFDSELLICDLHSWHPLSEPRYRYELWGCESARTSDATIVRPIAEWPDWEHGPTDERTPRVPN
jgi:restriction endonuclease